MLKLGETVSEDVAERVAETLPLPVFDSDGEADALTVPDAVGELDGVEEALPVEVPDRLEV